MTSFIAKSRNGLFGALMALAGVVILSPAAWAGDHTGAPFEFEIVPEAEVDDIEKTTELTVTLQDIRAKTDALQNGRLLRGVHAKSHGCVKAEFVIRGDIAEKYQVGLFQQPGKVFDAWIRFSNASVLIEDDLKANREGVRQNGSRGMAIKVLDVKGAMLSEDNGRSNQDFLMINTPEFAFANVRDYLRLNRILAEDPKGADPTPFFLPAILLGMGEAEMFASLSPDEQRGTLASAKIAGKIARQTVRNPLQVQYFGAAPFLFGSTRAMKFSAQPCAETRQEPFDPSTITADNPDENYLRAALSQTMKGPDNVCYDFKLKVRSVESDRLNIEDATTTWPDDGTGYTNVARITIKVPQSPDTDESKEFCEKLAFSPWHALAEHQPLGGINRLRGDVYSASANNRSTGDD